MAPILCLLLLAGSPQLADVSSDNPESLFERARTWEQFLSGVSANRALWLKNASWADVPPGLVERLTHVGTDLRLLIVAEDWCADSVNTVPYIARLASSARVELRIIDRTAGEPLMKRHRTSDGRTVTPVVVLVRKGRDVGAWVERPAALQKLFLSMAADPENARRFTDRQSWYDSDRGRTTLEEVVALAERADAAR